MGRKNLATERTAQILDAFERCIVQYGLEGASLEKIASEAGMKRSIIRHYVGNRDDLLDALIERIVHNYQENLAKADAEVEGISARYYLPQVMDYLFKPEGSNKPQDKVIIDVLMTAKDRYPKAKEFLKDLFTALTNSLAKDLIDAYPKADTTHCYQVAYGILCLSMTNESMMWLGMDVSFNQSARECADSLLHTLE